MTSFTLDQINAHNARVAAGNRKPAATVLEPVLGAQRGAQEAGAGVQKKKAKRNDHNADSQIPDTEPQQRPGALENNCEAQARGTGRTALRFTLYRVRLLDPCAKYGSCKAIIDGLRYAGIIHNDREEDITLQVDQTKIAHFKDEKTTLEITFP